MQVWRNRYDEEKRKSPSLPVFRHWVSTIVMEAICSGSENITQRVEDLAAGPNEEAQFWTHCWAFGSHYRIRSRETENKSTFDCGVNAKFDEGGVETPYYGYLDSIVTLNYCSFRITLFHVKWYKSITKGIRQNLCLDECGHNRIKIGAFLSEKKETDEPFVQPEEVDQVFYIPDRIYRGWHLIVHSGSRSKRVIYKRETEDLQVSDEDELDQQQPAPSHDLEVPQPTHRQPVRIQFEDLSGSESSNEGGINTEGPNPTNGGRRSGGTSTANNGRHSGRPSNRSDTKARKNLETQVHNVHTNHTHARSCTNNQFRTEEGEESSESIKPKDLQWS